MEADEIVSVGPVIEGDPPVGPTAPVAVIDPGVADIAVEALEGPVIATCIARRPAFLLDRPFDATLVTAHAHVASIPVAARCALVTAAPFGAGLTAMAASALGTGVTTLAALLGMGRLTAMATAAAAALVLGQCRHRKPQGRRTGEKHQLTHVEFPLYCI